MFVTNSGLAWMILKTNPDFGSVWKQTRALQHGLYRIDLRGKCLLWEVKQILPTF